MRFDDRYPWHWILALGLVMSGARGLALAQSEVDESVEATPPAAAKSPAEQEPVGPAPAMPPVSAAQIAEWIAALDSDRYLVREGATQDLLSALRAGNVAALDPLLAAANSNRPEQVDRAVWVMRQLIDADNLELRQQVLERLVQVRGRPQVVAEARLALSQIRHDFAVQRLEQLGARLYEQGVDAYWGQLMPRRIVFAGEWKGGDEGLKHCADLRDVQLVLVFGTDITADGLAQLAGTESIRSIRLYGTRLTEEDAAELQTRLTGIDVDHRRGAFLGILGDDNPQAAVVRTVQPNTAAADAGLRPSDVIRKFNGRPVSNFKDLTREIAKHLPGDEVTLEVDRGAGPTEVTLKLGEWKAP